MDDNCVLTHVPMLEWESTPIVLKFFFFYLSPIPLTQKKDAPCEKLHPISARFLQTVVPKTREILISNCRTESYV